ncbi:MAG: class II aldolase/adducin family protein [Acidobacteria bacterium]|nr:MAG: class II aldolase/adducin family protein [Acidobacteriota bacterium]REK07698.1 MAG: class II aldolase/adducin family protein [Acidobacteriota bacterium]
MRAMRAMRAGDDNDPGSAPRRANADEAALRVEMTGTARRLLELGLVSGTAGNLSCRLDGDHVLVTPSAVPYSELAAEDLVVVDDAGSVVRSRQGRRPTSELALHLAALDAAPEIGAVVHSHAVHATAFATAGQSLPCVLEEMAYYLGGDVPVAEYRLTGTRELAVVAAPHLRERAAVLLANHGLLTVGRDLGEALDMTRLVDRCARIVLAARRLGGERPLPEEAIRELTRGWSERRARGSAAVAP